MRGVAAEEGPFPPILSRPLPSRGGAGIPAAARSGSAGAGRQAGREMAAQKINEALEHIAKAEK